VTVRSVCGIFARRSSIKTLMAICNGVATVLRYSTTVVKCMASVDRMTENGEWEGMRKGTFVIYFKVLFQNFPWRIKKTPQAKLNFSFSDSDPLFLEYAASMSEHGGRKRIFNTVDICNFMLQAFFLGGGGGQILGSPFFFSIFFSPQLCVRSFCFSRA